MTSAKLFILGEERELLYIYTNYYKHIANNGSPTSDINGGLIHLSFISQEGDDVFFHNMLKKVDKETDRMEKGEIYFYSKGDKDIPVRKYEFNDAYLIGLSEVFYADSPNNMIINLTISPAIQNYGTPVDFIKSWQVSWIPPADPVYYIPKEEEEDRIIYINGHFYNKDGTFEGKISEPDFEGSVNDVYVCDGKSTKKDKNGNEALTYNNAKIVKFFDTNLFHSDLLIYGGIVNGEATNQNSTNIGIELNELKVERYCIANAIYNFMKSTDKKNLSELSSSYSYAKKDETASYKLVIDSTDEMRKNNQWIKIAIFSVLNAILEINDYSNGATFWDGPDVMTGNYAGGYDPMKHYRQKALNGTEYRVQGIYDPKALSTKFYENAKLYYTAYDTQRSSHLQKLTKYGEMIHYDVVILEGTRIVCVSNSIKNESFNKKDTILEELGSAAFRVVIKCLWEIKMQSACSIFYKQMISKY